MEIKIMTDFEKIDSMIAMIEENQIPEGKTFNEFSMEFFQEVKLLPLSKYLRSVGRHKRLPKIMNMRKAGEVLTDTYSDSDLVSFVKRKSKQGEIPELDYQSIMLLRRIDVKDNWEKIFRFFRGSETVAEINSTTRPDLLPQEIETLENFLKEKLRLNEKELDWLLEKFHKILSEKELLRAIRKLAK